MTIREYILTSTFPPDARAAGPVILSGRSRGSPDHSGRCKPVDDRCRGEDNLQAYLVAFAELFRNRSSQLIELFRSNIL